MANKTVFIRLNITDTDDDVTAILTQIAGDNLEDEEWQAIFGKHWQDATP